MRTVEIGRRRVGPGEPCLIIAEAGVNHEGSLERAEWLARIAREAGADIVKYQVVTPENVISTRELEKVDRLRRERGEEPLFEMLKRLELRPDDFRRLRRYCDEIGIEFAASFIDADGADLLEEIGVGFFKLASGELTNLPLLRHVARKGRPMILSTGMATLEEVEEAVEAVRAAGCDALALLHCVSAYPAGVEEINLDAIGTLRRAFQVPVGYSDHTVGPLAVIAAVCRGAEIVEKHVTYDRTLPGADHAHSSDPQELAYIVRTIRTLERAFGHGRKEPAPGEREARVAFRRSVVARVPIAEGETITPDKVTCKRPATGIPPRLVDTLYGRVAKRPIDADETITWEMV
jgi:N-acetylneuraminate synthase/N,N'-diacetyllegionaminate synthase